MFFLYFSRLAICTDDDHNVWLVYLVMFSFISLSFLPSLRFARTMITMSRCHGGVFLISLIKVLRIYLVFGALDTWRGDSLSDVCFVLFCLAMGVRYYPWAT